MVRKIMRDVELKHTDTLQTSGYAMKPADNWGTSSVSPLTPMAMESERPSRIK